MAKIVKIPIICTLLLSIYLKLWIFVRFNYIICVKLFIFASVFVPITQT